MEFNRKAFAFRVCVCVCVGGAIKGIKAGLFQILLFKKGRKKRNVLNLQIPRNHWVYAKRFTKFQMSNRICVWHNSQLKGNSRYADQIQNNNKTERMKDIYFSFFLSCHVMSSKRCCSNALNKSVSMAICANDELSNGNGRYENKELKYIKCVPIEIVKYANKMITSMAFGICCACFMNNSFDVLSISFSSGIISLWISRLTWMQNDRWFSDSEWITAGYRCDSE